MKYISLTVLALITMSTEGVKIGSPFDNGKGTAYDLDVPSLKKAEAINDSNYWDLKAAMAT